MRAIQTIVVVFLLCVLVGSQAATAQMQRPLLGFVVGANPIDVRAVLGIPGAAVMSDRLELPPEVRKVHFAPKQQYAILERNTDLPISILTFAGSESGPILDIAGILINADVLSFIQTAHVLFCIHPQKDVYN